MEVKYKQLVDFNDYFIKKPLGDAAVDLRVASLDCVLSDSNILVDSKPEFLKINENKDGRYDTVPGNIYSIRTGMSVEIPEGFVGLLSLRSSFARAGFMMMNPPGIIDAGFRNEILATVMLVIPHSVLVPKWYRAVQLTIVPHNAINLMEVAILSDSERGMGGFGSTGGM